MEDESVEVSSVYDPLQLSEQLLNHSLKAYWKLGFVCLIYLVII